MLPSEELVKAVRAYMRRRGHERSEQRRLAEDAEVSQPTISRLISAPLPTVSYSTWLKLHEAHPEEIPPPGGPEKTVAFKTPENVELLSIVKGIRNPKRAIEIIKKLTILNRGDPAAFDEVVQFIDFKISGLNPAIKKKLKKGPISLQ